jgi:hypothetical protein
LDAWATRMGILGRASRVRRRPGWTRRRGLHPAAGIGLGLCRLLGVSGQPGQFKGRRLRAEGFFIIANGGMAAALRGCGGAGLRARFSWRWLPRRMAMCTIFLFLDSATYIRIDGALDYWCARPGPARRPRGALGRRSAAAALNGCNRHRLLHLHGLLLLHRSRLRPPQEPWRLRPQQDVAPAAATGRSCASFVFNCFSLSDFRERAAILDHTIRGALSPPNTSRVPGSATQCHAQARDSNAAQGNTQDRKATLAYLLRKECHGCSEARRPSRPAPRIQSSGAIVTS